MQLTAPAPLADHPLADPRPIWIAGAAGGVVALAWGLGPGAAATTLCTWLIGAGIAHVRGVRAGRVRPWSVPEPWRGQVERAVDALRIHGRAMEAASGPLAERLRREHEAMGEILEDLWEIALWGARNVPLAAQGSPGLAAEVRAAHRDVTELADGLAAAGRSAMELVALAARPTSSDVLYDVAELQETAKAYRLAVGSIDRLET